jgi:hypothetical protein
MLLASADAPRPDFVLRIALSADRRQLSYTLHSPTGKLGLVYQRMGSVRLESDPRTFMENTLLGLSQMARASKKKLTEAQFAANQEKLREIGWDLYEQLFTPALRRAYRAMRQLRQQQPELSLLIVSDEPWIPWEMILPHEDDLPDEDFLCAQFRLTRWLDGRGLPEDFSLHQARVVVPKSNLASVKAEQDFFSQELPKLRPDISYGGAWLDMASQVTDALRAGDTQLFHFACHGDFDTTRPDESALKLQGRLAAPQPDRRADAQRRGRQPAAGLPQRLPHRRDRLLADRHGRLGSALRARRRQRLRRQPVGGQRRAGRAVCHPVLQPTADRPDPGRRLPHRPRPHPRPGRGQPHLAGLHALRRPQRTRQTPRPLTIPQFPIPHSPFPINH